MKRQIIRLKESELHNIIKESVKRIIREEAEDDFEAHGYKTTSNSGGRLIQISADGSCARVKYEDGSVSDWMEIEYREPNEDEDWYDDEDSVPYVNGDRGEEKLDDYMRTR